MTLPKFASATSSKFECRTINRKLLEGKKTMGVTTKLGVIAAAEFDLPKDHSACWITVFC